MKWEMYSRLFSQFRKFLTVFDLFFPCRFGIGYGNFKFSQEDVNFLFLKINFRKCLCFSKIFFNQ